MNRQSLERNFLRPATEPEASPWWSPRAHSERRAFLTARAKILSTLRRSIEDAGFLEVEPGTLQISPGAETHLSAFSTELLEADGRARTLFLHASPEFACKKLLAAGEEKIFFLGRVFRNRDRGPLHLPEFTLLEWYRARALLSEMEQDCWTFLQLAAQAAGARRFAWRGVEADPFAEPERLSVADAFELYAGIDLAATMDERGEGDPLSLAEAARGAGLRVAPDDSWSDLFSKVLSAKVEPQLGRGRPTFLTDYPASEAALARRSATDPRFAQRFELYCCGVELANAFGEQTDAPEQRRRLIAEMDERERIYGERYPIDEEFLAALSFMPEASGCALGFDRLAMLAAGAERIDQVAWTPIS